MKLNRHFNIVRKRRIRCSEWMPTFRQHASYMPITCCKSRTVLTHWSTAILCSRSASPPRFTPLQQPFSSVLRKLCRQHE